MPILNYIYPLVRWGKFENISMQGHQLIHITYALAFFHLLQIKKKRWKAPSTQGLYWIKSKWENLNSELLKMEHIETLIFMNVFIFSRSNFICSEMVSRWNFKCPHIGSDVRFPIGELKVNPELHLPLMVIIFIERATWCESSSSYYSLTYTPFPAKNPIKRNTHGSDPFVLKLQPYKKIGWWRIYFYQGG